VSATVPKLLLETKHKKFHYLEALVLNYCTRNSYGTRIGVGEGKGKGREGGEERGEGGEERERGEGK